MEYNDEHLIGDQICSIADRGTNPGVGDSGGPLIQKPSIEGIGLQIGIVSFRYIGFPAVYTQITSYRDWIKKISGE